MWKSQKIIEKYLSYGKTCNIIQHNETIPSTNQFAVLRHNQPKSFLKIYDVPPMSTV